MRRPSADLDLLREHDDRAYEKALQSGGLLRYFKGEANEQRECLSFCLWETRGQAMRAALPHTDLQPRSRCGCTNPTCWSATV
jgi:hypothetical protein